MLKTKFGCSSARGTQKHMRRSSEIQSRGELQDHSRGAVAILHSAPILYCPIRLFSKASAWTQSESDMVQKTKLYKNINFF